LYWVVLLERPERKTLNKNNSYNFFSCCAVSPTDTIPAKISPPSYQYPSVTASGTPLTSPPASSYPAVLVGRSSNESKPKVPPPVPPRGTPKAKKGSVNGKGAKHRFGRVAPRRSHANNTLLFAERNVHGEGTHRRSRSEGSATGAGFFRCRLSSRTGGFCLKKRAAVYGKLRTAKS
jgi:hypothetical protein